MMDQFAKSDYLVLIDFILAVALQQRTIMSCRGPTRQINSLAHRLP